MLVWIKSLERTDHVVNIALLCKMDLIQNICNYHKYGYCKFRENCTLRHVDKICDDKECDIKTCVNRHPRDCPYYRENRCKFGTRCSFHHSIHIVDSGSCDDDLKKLQLQMTKISNLVDEKTLAIAELNEKIVTHEMITNNISSIDQKYAPMLDRVQELGDNYFILIHAVDDLEKAVKSMQIILRQHRPSFTCSYCGKGFTNDSMLRNHLLNDHRN